MGACSLLCPAVSWAAVRGAEEKWLCPVQCTRLKEQRCVPSLGVLGRALRKPSATAAGASHPRALPCFHKLSTERLEGAAEKTWGANQLFLRGVTVLVFVPLCFYREWRLLGKLCPTCSSASDEPGAAAQNRALPWCGAVPSPSVLPCST